MKSTQRLAAATAAAACSLALAACSAGGGVPGIPSVPGVDDTGSPAVTHTERGPEPCVDSSRELAPPDQDPEQNPDQAFCAPPPSTTPVTTPPAPEPAPSPTSSTSLPSAPTASTPGPSTEPAPTEKAKAYGLLHTDDKNTFIRSEVPFLAGVMTPEKQIVASYAFERMDVDFACTGPDAVAPENGHFVRVFYFLGNSRADRETGLTLDVTESTWSFLGEDGQTWNGTIVTEAAKKCLKSTDGEWGGKAKPGWIAGGELIFDLPSTQGLLQHNWKPEVGGWRFPVENANTSFRSLDERAAENFGK